MARLLFHYYKTLMQFNLPFSVLFGVAGIVMHKNLVGFVNSFNLSLLTGGFVLSLYFYERMFKRQYYFYYNHGLSRLVLIGTVVIANLLLAILLYSLTLLAHT